MGSKINNALDVTFLMPCLNEAETIETCIKKAQEFLKRNNLNGEVLIADNGSVDGSQLIAKQNNAKLIDVKTKGYGSALKQEYSKREVNSSSWVMLMTVTPSMKWTVFTRLY